MLSCWLWPLWIGGLLGDFGATGPVIRLTNIALLHANGSDELCGGVGIWLFRKRLRIDEVFLPGLSGRRFASIFVSNEFTERWDDISLDAGLADK